MNKARAILLFVCVLMMLGGNQSTYAAEGVNKKPLDEVFDHMVVIPYDYKSKAFINGNKADVFGEYEMVQRDGRVLVPIRLMSYLAGQVNRNYGEWAAIWLPEKPNDVLLTNAQLQKTIKFTVNSKTMLVNNKAQTLDVAPQKINGRIVLPLRSAAEALDKKIEWFDGLILISDEYVDLQHPKTLAIKDQIKVELGDTRKPLDEKVLTPVTKYGNTIYYTKQSGELYRKTDGQKEVKVSLNGDPLLYQYRLINQELYYVTKFNNQMELDAYSLADHHNRKVSNLDESWDPGFGWLEDIQYIDNELYINLHYGDITMGSETLYKVEQATLKHVADSKSFIRYMKAGDQLYSTTFNPMADISNNLNRINVKTGEVTALGEAGYAYGINRSITDESIRYSTDAAMYILDDYLYTLGYKESDREDVSSVYKINLKDQTQVRLTSSANQFWLLNNEIYYIDGSAGHLAKVDLDGSNKQILVDREVMKVEFHEGSIYYTANENGNFSGLGELYQYHIAKKQEVKLSDMLIDSYYVGKTGIYYVLNGYDLGMYKIDAGGHNARLVKDSIETARLTDAGMVYTLRYKEGIYFVK